MSSKTKTSKAERIAREQTNKAKRVAAAKTQRTRKPTADTTAKTAAPAPASTTLTEQEQQIATRYGIEIKPGSLRYDETLRKKVLVMYCRYCQKPRTIATQDCFQVVTCGERACKKAHKTTAKTSSK